MSPDSSSSNADEFIAGIDVPIVQVGGRPHPNRSSVLLDYEREGYEVGRLLLAEGRTEPIFIGNDLATNPQLAGLRRSFEEAGVMLNESLLLNSDAELSNHFETILNIKRIPEAIYAANGSLRRISAFINKRNLDWINDCRLVADRDTLPVPGWMIWAGCTGNRPHRFGTARRENRRAGLSGSDRHGFPFPVPERTDG